MSRIIVVPGADASGLGRGSVSLDDFDKEIGRLPGLIHLVDPEQVPGYQTNGVYALAFKDRVRGRPLRASPAAVPIMATESGVANSRPLFDVTGVAECDLTAQDPTFTPTLTFIGLFRPTPESLDGTGENYLLRALEGTTGRLAFRITSGGTPTLLLTDEETQGVAWTFGSSLVPGTPVVLAFVIDGATYKIFKDTGVLPAASANKTLAPHPAAQFTFMGSKQASGSWRGRAGRMAVWNRALNPAELIRAMDAFRDYYDVTT